MFDSIQLYVCNTFANVLVNPTCYICQNDSTHKCAIEAFTLKSIVVNIQTDVINVKNINIKK